MKKYLLKILLLLLIPFGLAAQQVPENLLGYWIEKGEGSSITLSTLVVFETNDQGMLKGSVFFLESEDHTREFALNKIELDGDELSFGISNTTISFYGKVDSGLSQLYGSFYLDGDKAVEVVHKKLDNKRAAEMKRQKRWVPRKRIDHTSGLMTG